MFLINIIVYYILPIMYDSMVALLMVLFFLFIFRVKDPAIRTAFFFIPLIKPFLMIIERIDLNDLYFQYGTWALGPRFPDPTKMINIADQTESVNFLYVSEANYIILISIVASVLLILIIRWINLAMFYRNLAYEEKVTKNEIPAIYNIIDRFSTKIIIKPPDVSLTHKDYYSPFVVGIKNYTLIFSPKLLEILSQSEIETITQHELSHIKRSDNLVAWVALILRDLNFFNPFGFISYYLIRAEQERGSDLLTVEFSSKKPQEIANNIVNSIVKLKDMTHRSKKLVPNYGSNFITRTIDKIRLNNRITNILKFGKQRIHARVATKIFLYFLFVFTLLIQLFFVFKINDFTLILR